MGNVAEKKDWRRGLSTFDFIVKNILLLIILLLLSIPALIGVINAHLGYVNWLSYLTVNEVELAIENGEISFDDVGSPEALELIKERVTEAHLFAFWVENTTISYDDNYGYGNEIITSIPLWGMAPIGRDKDAWWAYSGDKYEWVTSGHGYDYDKRSYVMMGFYHLKDKGDDVE